jgi:hypothetical protein
MEMVSTVRGEYHPNKVIMLKTPENGARLAAISDYTANQITVNGQGTAYVCKNFVCEMPTNSSAQLLENIIRAGLIKAE